MPNSAEDFTVPVETITLPAQLDAITNVNQMLERMLQGRLAPALFKTQLVVEELLANICSYAYDGQNGEAEFACGVVNFDGSPAIMLQLTDHGKPYDPFANAKEPDLDAALEDRQIGGLGLHLVKELCAHYAYIRLNNCNQTQIILALEPDEASGA